MVGSRGARRHHRDQMCSRSARGVPFVLPGLVLRRRPDSTPCLPPGVCGAGPRSAGGDTGTDVGWAGDGMGLRPPPVLMHPEAPSPEGLWQFEGWGGELTMPHAAEPQHTNDWAPRTRKRHQQEHRPQQPTERSDPTQHAEGRTGDCPGPRKETTTRRNVTQGVDPPPCQQDAQAHSAPKAPEKPIASRKAPQTHLALRRGSKQIFPPFGGEMWTCCGPFHTRHASPQGTPWTHQGNKVHRRSQPISSHAGRQAVGEAGRHAGRTTQLGFFWCQALGKGDPRTMTDGGGWLCNDCGVRRRGGEDNHSSVDPSPAGLNGLNCVGAQTTFGGGGGGVPAQPPQVITHRNGLRPGQAFF